jgi:EXLDI family protein
MPNKTIYVSDDDLPLFRKAQDIAGGNLSAAILAAIRRYVEVEEGRQEGYEEITVKVGPGPGRKVRFTGVLLGEWGRSTSTNVEVFKVFRSQKGRFVVHTERSPDVVWTAGDKPAAGWRAVLNAFSPNQTWGSTQGEATLDVVDTVEELREKIPPELYDLIASVARQPPVEDLDI